MKNVAAIGNVTLTFSLFFIVEFRLTVALFFK